MGPIPQPFNLLASDNRSSHLDERLNGNRYLDPGEPGLPDLSDNPFPPRLLAAEGGPFPVPIGATGGTRCAVWSAGA